MNRLQFQPSDKFNGGNFDYEPSASGLVKWAYDMAITLLWSPKHYTGSGEQQVQPELLQSKNCAVGETIKFAGITIVVQKIVGTNAYADIEISMSGVQVSGMAVIDLSADLIKISNVHASIHVPIYGTLSVVAVDVPYPS